jgi:hypothetical protein
MELYMSEKKTLKSFKIAETQKPKVKSAAKPKKAEVEETPENGTLGFARIEALLDKESPAEVQRHLTVLFDSLTSLEADAKTQKAKAGIKRAKLAVERTTALLEYLFRTKADMQAAVEATIVGTTSKK